MHYPLIALFLSAFRSVLCWFFLFFYTVLVFSSSSPSMHFLLMLLLLGSASNIADLQLFVDVVVALKLQRRQNKTKEEQTRTLDLGTK